MFERKMKNVLLVCPPLAAPKSLFSKNLILKSLKQPIQLNEHNGMYMTKI